MSDLPHNWTQCQIGDVAKIVAGGTPPSKDASNFGLADSGVPWITPADLSGYRSTYISRGARNLSEKGFNACSAVKMPAGSVLFSSRAPIGYVAIAANEISTNQGFKSFVLPLGLNSHFVYYYLKHIKPIAEAMATGTTFKELSGSVASQLPFFFAPTNEQTRIADKLDAVLARVDACRDRLDRIPSILKRFRQSVLVAATSGNLTEDWRTEQAARMQAKAKFERNAHGSIHLGCAIAEPPENAENLPDDWRWIAVGDLATKVADGVHKKPNYVETGIPFLTVRNLTAGPGLDFSNTSFVTHSDHEEFCKRTHPERDDILISKDGTLGVVRLIDTDQVFSIFVSVALIKLRDKRMSRYMRIALESPVLQKQMVGVGTGLQHIHLRDLRQDVVPVPPLDEQTEIVRRVEVLFAFADRIEARYTTARAQVEKLTPSLLAKAFRGELVPQDPNDEPASELLARIRAQRNAHTDTPPQRGRARKAATS